MPENLRLVTLDILPNLYILPVDFFIASNPASAISCSKDHCGGNSLKNFELKELYNKF